MKNLLLSILASVACAGLGIAEEAKLVNTKCPVTGKNVNPERAVAYTKVVGVCCEKCQAKVVKDVAGNAEKIAGVTAKAVNSKCPVSGKDADTEKLVSYQGAQVAVCCDKCVKGFDAEKHGSKVVMDLAGNDKCIFSGKEVDADAHAVVSINIGVCCGKCEKKLIANPDKFLAKVEFTATKAEPATAE